MGNQTFASLQNIDAKVGHQHCRRTGTLNEMQDIVVQENEDEEEEEEKSLYSHSTRF